MGRRRKTSSGGVGGREERKVDPPYTLVKSDETPVSVSPEGQCTDVTVYHVFNPTRVFETEVPSGNDTQ